MGVAAAYLLQILSPLRINTDSSVLLSMALSAFEGKGYLFQGQPTQYPPGYPFVIKTLLQLHLASSGLLIALNLVFLLIGLLVLRAWSKIGGNHGVNSWLPALLVLASWVMIKHVTIPLTEFPYLGSSLLSLHFVTAFWNQGGKQKWLSFAAGAILAVMSIQFRTIGLSLLPLFPLTAFLHRDHAPLRVFLIKRGRFPVGMMVTGAILIVVIWLVARSTGWYKLQFIGNDSYGQALRATYRNGIMRTLFYSTEWLLLEFGTLFSNIPLEKVPQLRSLFYPTGLFFLGAVLYGGTLLLRAGRLLPLPLYCLSYSGIVFIWAGYDPRLFLPLLPVLVHLVLTAVDDMVRRRPVLRTPFVCYLAGYLLLGVIALLYSSRISLSGVDFGERYGNGTRRMTYRYAFHSKKQVDISHVDAGEAKLLRTFEPLAMHSPDGDPHVSRDIPHR